LIAFRSSRASLQIITSAFVIPLRGSFMALEIRADVTTRPD
jgi:hypothetical protein